MDCTLARRRAGCKPGNFGRFPITQSVTELTSSSTNEKSQLPRRELYEEFIFLRGCGVDHHLSATLSDISLQFRVHKGVGRAAVFGFTRLALRRLHTT